MKSLKDLYDKLDESDDLDLNNLKNDKNLEKDKLKGENQKNQKMTEEKKISEIRKGSEEHLTKLNKRMNRKGKYEENKKEKNKEENEDKKNEGSIVVDFSMRTALLYGIMLFFVGKFILGLFHVEDEITESVKNINRLFY